MFDLLNALVCAAMLIFSFPVAAAMSHRGVWIFRLVFIVGVVMIGAQMASPIFDFLPKASWLQAGFNLMILIAGLLSREEAMTLVRVKAGPQPAQDSFIAKAQELETGVLSRVVGGVTGDAG